MAAREVTSPVAGHATATSTPRRLTGRRLGQPSTGPDAEARRRVAPGPVRAPTWQGRRGSESPTAASRRAADPSGLHRFQVGARPSRPAATPRSRGRGNFAPPQAPRRPPPPADFCPGGRGRLTTPAAPACRTPESVTVAESSGRWARLITCLIDDLDRNPISAALQRFHTELSEGKLIFWRHLLKKQIRSQTGDNRDT